MTNIGTIQDEIAQLAESYSQRLQAAADKRLTEVQGDREHYLAYQALGITDSESELIETSQSKGIYLYKYAGYFLEEATELCFRQAFPTLETNVKIPNQTGSRPKTFSIDYLIGNDAYSIKWRDAATDNEYVVREHTKAQNIKFSGYKPMGLMFFCPNKPQAQRIQQTLRTLYAGIGGEYYYGDDAWDLIEDRTGIDLLQIVKNLAASKNNS